jgi:hypothetical protein
MSKENEELESLTEVASFVEDLREFALTVGEDCPEGHRRDPASGRCLPIGGTDYTKFTRSLNDEQGPEWRGEVVREENDQTLAATETEVAVDAEEMDTPESCAEGTTFSFIKRRCIPVEEAEAEDFDEFALEENEEEAAAPGKGGHPEIVQMQPEGRRDTVNHNCPPGEFFDFVLRSCIPLDPKKKETRQPGDTTKASVEGKEVAFGRVARTSPDPVDGHTHMVTVDMDGNGVTSVAIGGITESYPHSHKVAKFEVTQHAIGKESDYVSRHPGVVNPMASDDDHSEVYGDTTLASLATIEGVDFGLPEKQFFPLNTKEKAEQTINAFEHIKKDLSPAEQTTLLHNLTIAASKYNITDAFSQLPSITATPGWFTKVFNREFQKVVASLDEDDKEGAAPIKSKQRNALPASSFGVPGKRKFPLDSCARVRNAMARFNQSKGLTSSEKATLRRKILARAKACGIEVRNFGKATTEAEFAQVVVDLLRAQAAELKQSLDERYAAKEEAERRGPCPPGMLWDAAHKRCGRTQGFVDKVKANHADIVKIQPEGRRDTVGHQCPPGQFFDYVMRRCLPLDPSRKEGTTTEKAENEDAQRDLAPSPKGRPVRLSTDCPKGTIWDKDLNKCKPLDSSKKTKSEEEEAAIPPQFLKNIKKKGKDGEDDKKGKKGKKGKMAPPFGKKAKSEEEEDATSHGDMPMKPAKKKKEAKKKMAGKGEVQEDADAKPGNREGLTPPPAGKVQHQSDCPPNTAWDAKMKICRPIDSMDKDRPSGASPQSPRSTADDVEGLSPARLIQELDRIISEQGENRGKSRVAAKDLPNAAFPPSTVGSTRRVLMHHTPGVEDPYDSASVDIGRLRNALARANRVEGFSERAVEDALDHLLYHAYEVITEAHGKKE